MFDYEWVVGELPRLSLSLSLASAKASLFLFVQKKKKKTLLCFDKAASSSQDMRLDLC